MNAIMLYGDDHGYATCSRRAAGQASDQRYFSATSSASSSRVADQRIQARERGLAAEVRQAREQRWLGENRAALDAWDDYFEPDGLPLADRSPPAARDLNPIFDVLEVPNLRVPPALASIPAKEPRGRVASLQTEHDAILGALDIILPGD